MSVNAAPAARPVATCVPERKMLIDVAFAGIAAGAVPVICSVPMDTAGAVAGADGTGGGAARRRMIAVGPARLVLVVADRVDA